MFANPRSESIEKPAGHFSNLFPHSSTSAVSVGRPKYMCVCSTDSPAGVDHEITRNALWCTLSDQHARVMRVFDRGVWIMKSLPSGTSPTFVSHAHAWTSASFPCRPAARSRAGVSRSLRITCLNPSRASKAFRSLLASFSRTWLQRRTKFVKLSRNSGGNCHWTSGPPWLVH